MNCSTQIKTHILGIPDYLDDDDDGDGIPDSEDDDDDGDGIPDSQENVDSDGDGT